MPHSLSYDLFVKNFIHKFMSKKYKTKSIYKHIVKYFTIKLNIINNTPV